ncbi:Uncharacterised protein g7134 [Pycnogonum litorale]
MMMMMMNVYTKLVLHLFIVSTSISLITGHKSQIHKRMTNEHLVRTFRVDSHEQVPSYDIVHIRSIQRRGADDEDSKVLHMSAFGKKIKLDLKKNDDVNSNIKGVKIFSAQTKPDGHVDLQEEHDSGEETSDEIGEAYQDKEKMAAVVLRHGVNGDLEVEGIIGHNLVVRPIPKSVLDEIDHLPGNWDYEEDETDDEYVDDEVFLDDNDPNDIGDKKIHKKVNNVNEKFNRVVKDVPHVVRTPGGGSVHVVYHTNTSEVDSDHTDYMFMEGAMEKKFAAKLNQVNSTHSRHKRATTGPIYPEILAIVDYESYIMHGKNNREIKRYMVSFWNGVDMRYRLLSSPKIRVSLAGIIISKDSNANPYLERNRLSRSNKDAVDATGALTDLGRYLYRERRLPVYDAAVVITKLDMCRRRYSSGRCNRGTAGFAYVGGACVVNKRLEKVNSVAIIEDTGGFSGIIVAAHEVGHLLGCVHDGSPAPSYLGGPGAKHCLWKDGYIMSDLRHTERGFKWSSCSIQQFNHFLNGETADCLFNYPSQSQNLERVLPGKLLSLDAQCKRDRGTSACFKDSRVCAQLFCFDSSSGYCVSYRPAAEGSPCGNGQHCRNGQCVPDNDNVIPDYSQQTETYVANQRSGFGGRQHYAEDKPQTTTTTTTTKSPSIYRTRKYQIRRPTRKYYGSYTTKSYNRSTRKPFTTRKPYRSIYSRSKYTHRIRSYVSSSSNKEPSKTDDDDTCVDKVRSVAGLTCSKFLERHKTHHCETNYMKQNCCASRLKICVQR